MINRKQTKTMSLAIVGMALLATVISISSPTQALALGHWNLDEDFAPSSGLSEDGMDKSGTTDNTKEEDEDRTTAATTDDDEEEGSGDSSDDSTSEEEDSTHARLSQFTGMSFWYRRRTITYGAGSARLYGIKLRGNGQQ